MNTKELIDRIFKEASVKFELTEFENLGKPIHDILTIYPKTASTGKDAGKVKFYLKSFIPFSTGNEAVQVYAEGGKSAPEEIIRQLWVYKLIHQYGYPFDIRKLLVWDAPTELQRELRDLHDAAASAEQELHRLLEQAKTRVEQLIEAAVQP